MSNPVPRAAPLPPIHQEVVELQALIFARRLKVGAVMKRAGIQASTWWRWTQGAEPKLSTLAKVRRVLEELEHAA